MSQSSVEAVPSATFNRTNTNLCSPWYRWSPVGTRLTLPFDRVDQSFGTKRSALPMGPECIAGRKAQLLETHELIGGVSGSQSVRRASMGMGASLIRRERARG